MNGRTYPLARPGMAGKGKRLWSVLAAGLLCLTGAPNVRAAADGEVLDRDVFLRAIAEVETGSNARAVGRRGERGMYQFSRLTWRQHTTRSFHEAHNPAVAYGVAVEHYEWLHDSLVRGGRRPTPFLMAVAWNAGIRRALSGSTPATTRDYARRVSNIAMASRPAPAPAPVAPDQRPRIVVAAVAP